MDLNAIAGPVVAAVNPQMPVSVQVSVGSTTGADGAPTPSYATPGAVTASIAGDVLTVASQSAGVLQIGQTLAGVEVAPQTLITGLLTGNGGLGTYTVSVSQDVATIAMTTELVLYAQVQPIATRDLMQLDGINLGGVHWKAYLHGEVDAVVRPEHKGGDLMVIATGRHQGTWLIVQVLEQWPDWVCAAIVLQQD